MSVKIARSGPLVKRIPVSIDETEFVQTYDIDNLLPQRMEEIVARSGTATNAVKRLASFSHGQGLEIDSLNSTVINRNGLTLLQAIIFSANDWAMGSALAFHISYNADFKINNITPIFQKYCRLGIPDEIGNVEKIMYSDNWENDPNKTVTGERVIKEYDIFNPKPSIVRDQIKKCGGIFEYPGQILYYTPLPGIYPKPIYDPVLDDIQSEADLKLFNLRNIQNGFSSKFIFRYPGKPETKVEKDTIKKNIAEMSGPNNAGNTAVVFDPHPESNKPIIEPINHPNTDKMYSETMRVVKDNILECVGLPKPLANLTPDGGIFNDQDMEQAFKVYNLNTKGDRMHIESAYWMLLNPEFYKDQIIQDRPIIRPLKWEVSPIEQNIE